MVIVNDYQKRMNLNPFDIYIVLSREEMNSLPRKLHETNLTKSLGRHFFRFKFVEKRSDVCSGLPEAMAKFSQCNFYIRLVDQIHNIYSYGMDIIDMQQPIADVKSSIKSFIDDVCLENMLHLQIINSRLTKCALYARAEYQKSGLAIELFKRIYSCQISSKDSGVDLEQYLRSSGNYAERTTSFEIIQDTIGGQNQGKALQEFFSRTCPTLKSSISVTVKNLNPSNSHHKYGLLFRINEVECELYLNSTNSKMLYVSSLLCHKYGHSLSRSNFNFCSSKEMKNKLYPVYRAFGCYKDYDEWYQTISGSKCHNIDCTISTINNQIWDKLYDQYKNTNDKRLLEAYYYCQIRNIDKYSIFINPSNICFEGRFVDVEKSFGAIHV